MPTRRIYALTFVAGSASLGGEIAAARLLAPWFGDSTLIWANTIGVVLVALSAGYWLGGRLADRDPSLTRLAQILLLGSALFAVLPFVAEPFLRASVNALDTVSAGAFVGSLLAVLVLLAGPMAVIGTVSPYVAKLALARVEDAGRTVGRLYAISTLGSLAGTFLSSLLLIPFLGTRRTFLFFALALAIVAVAAIGRRRWSLAPVAIGLLIALPVGTVKATGDGRVIWEKETDYQYARVLELPDGQRQLELNEGQAIHSVYTPGQWLTGNYWDEFLTLPFAARPEGRPLRSVAILGDAAGTTARQYGHYFPATRVDGVELDGALNKLAHELFGLNARDAPNVRLHTADARPWLRASTRRFDAVFVDAYRQPYVPFYLTTHEFFELVREHLNPGGAVLVNVGHLEQSNALEKALTATMGSVFATVARDPSQPTNTILIASEAPLSGRSIRDALPDLPSDLRAPALQTAARVSPGLSGGEVYTDDRAPVEWLIDGSILHVAADGRK
ncbi:MAG TPA: fused MFS/spermidine synthase [Conexibacter sp.]